MRTNSCRLASPTKASALPSAFSRGGCIEQSGESVVKRPIGNELRGSQVIRVRGIRCTLELRDYAQLCAVPDVTFLGTHFPSRLNAERLPRHGLVYVGSPASTQNLAETARSA